MSLLHGGGKTIFPRRILQAVDGYRSDMGQDDDIQQMTLAIENLTNSLNEKYV